MPREETSLKNDAEKVAGRKCQWDYLAHRSKLGLKKERKAGKVKVRGSKVASIA